MRLIGTALLASIALLTGCATQPKYLGNYQPGDGAVITQPGKFNVSARVDDFPQTYISVIEIRQGSPDILRLQWTGPASAGKPVGPWPASTGAGMGDNDCNNTIESNREGSNCTPRGVFTVLGFSDQLRSVPECHYVTWVDIYRGIGIHSHPELPNYSASHGCVRIPYDAARIVHNNSRVGVTQIRITGTWIARLPSDDHQAIAR